MVTLYYFYWSEYYKEVVTVVKNKILQWKYGKWNYAFYFINVSQYFKYIINMLEEYCKCFRQKEVKTWAISQIRKSNGHVAFSKKKTQIYPNDNN